MSVRECRALGIANNQVLDSRSHGIAVRDSVGCRISDNTITELRAEPQMIKSVKVTGSSLHNVIQNNLVSAEIECPADCGQQRTNTSIPAVGRA